MTPMDYQPDSGTNRIPLTVPGPATIGNAWDLLLGADGVTQPLLLVVHGDPPADGLTAVLDDGAASIGIPARCYVDHVSIRDSSTPAQDLFVLDVWKVLDPGDRVGTDLRKMTIEASIR